MLQKPTIFFVKQMLAIACIQTSYHLPEGAQPELC